MEDVFLFGIAYSDDISYVLDALKAHSIPVHELSGEESRVAGYPLYLHRSEFTSASETIAATHRYRTGDLAFHILNFPPKIGEAIERSDHEAIISMQRRTRNGPKGAD